MHEWKGKRTGQIAKKGRIPRCNRLPLVPVAYLSPLLATNHISTQVLWPFKPILGHAPRDIWGRFWLEKFGSLRSRAKLAIASFIIHYVSLAS
jgi:hypothetical protein